MSAHDIILFSSFAETSLSQCHYLKPPLWKGGLAPKLPTDQKTRPNTNILVLSVLQPVASNLGEHLDAFGEATAQPLDIIVLVDVIATALEAPAVGFPSQPRRPEPCKCDFSAQIPCQTCHIKPQETFPN